MVCRESETVSKKQKREKGENLFSFVFFLYGNIARWEKIDVKLVGKNTYEEKNCVRKKQNDKTREKMRI